MIPEINSGNPVVRAIIQGTAPQPAKMAAARGMLPLPQQDLLEVLVALASDQNTELAASARETLRLQSDDSYVSIIETGEIAPSVLAYLAETDEISPALCEKVLTHPRTPAPSIVRFARRTADGEMLELISQNQQLLISNPTILDAIMANPYRTAEAERRASEIKKEFFEKERGAQQIANELRAQGKEAAAEFIEKSEFAAGLNSGKFNREDALFLAGMIEVPDSDVDDSWLSLEYIEELYEETDEEREAIVNKILGELKFEEDSISGERISMLNRILRMNMKDRMKLAMKGDREARNILIRDPNRIVAQAVIQNPKITEQEVEKIASMRTVPEDILRQVGSNRQWSRSYPIMHNLARNPRTPLGTAFTILNRLQLRDLIAISKNRNVSEAVRRQAFRLSSARVGR